MYDESTAEGNNLAGLGSRSSSNVQFFQHIEILGPAAGRVESACFVEYLQFVDSKNSAVTHRVVNQSTCNELPEAHEIERNRLVKKGETPKEFAKRICNSIAECFAKYRFSPSERRVLEWIKSLDYEVEVSEREKINDDAVSSGASVEKVGNSELEKISNDDDPLFVCLEEFFRKWIQYYADPADANAGNEQLNFPDLISWLASQDEKCLFELQSIRSGIRSAIKSEMKASVEIREKFESSLAATIAQKAILDGKIRDLCELLELGIASENRVEEWKANIEKRLYDLLSTEGYEAFLMRKNWIYLLSLQGPEKQHLDETCFVSHREQSSKRDIETLNKALRLEISTDINRVIQLCGEISQILNERLQTVMRMQSKEGFYLSRAVLILATEVWQWFSKRVGTDVHLSEMLLKVNFFNNLGVRE